MKLIYILLPIGLCAQSTLTLTTPPPPPVGTVTANVIGNQGTATYYYWVVTNYPIGKDGGAVTIVRNAPNALTLTNYVNISWTPIASATAYDVLRTTTSQFPGSCTCAVVVGTTSTFINDTGGVLVAYSYTGTGTAVGHISLDNLGYSQPRFLFDKPINIATVSTLPPAVQHKGELWVASDSLAYSCTVGGSTNTPGLCWSNGIAWVTSGSAGSSIVWPTTPGLTLCSGTPCNAWSPSVALPNICATGKVQNGYNSDGTPSCENPPIGGTITYYQTPTASSIATYLQATATPYSPKTTLTYAGLAAGTDTIANFATNAGTPNLTFIPAGAFLWHVHASRTGAAGTVTLQFQLWEATSAGVDIAQIGTTSEITLGLTTTETEYNIAFVTNNVYTMASTASRLVLRVQANVGTPSTPNVLLYVGGTADSHISLPSQTVDATNFVPYVGATTDVNIGTHDFITSSRLILPVTISSSSPITVSQGGHYYCDVAGGCTYNIPAILTATIGNEMCFENNTSRSGAITLQMPAATQISLYGTLGTAASTFVSNGLAGDAVCLVAKIVGIYMANPVSGFWTAN